MTEETETKSIVYEGMQHLILSGATRYVMVAHLASLCWRPDVECYFFGCLRRAGEGHVLWHRQGRGGHPTSAPEDAIRHALGAPLDGGLCWNSPKTQWGRSSYDRDEAEGRALLTRRNGWTAIAFWDRSVDRRGACNSAFIVKGEMSFAQVVRVARHRWPEVWARFSFGVVEVDGQGRRIGCAT